MIDRDQSVRGEQISDRAAIISFSPFSFFNTAGTIIDSFFPPEKSDITFEPLEAEEIAPKEKQIADRS